MAKKINCKHGLDRKQEIEARRLRVKLEGGDKETVDLYYSMFIEWFSAISMSFETFLKNKNPVYYSALVRAVSSKGQKDIYDKIRHR